MAERVFVVRAGSWLTAPDGDPDVVGFGQCRTCEGPVLSASGEVATFIEDTVLVIGDEAAHHLRCRPVGPVDTGRRL